MEKVMRFLKDEEGASMVEYGLLIAFIALVVAAGATTLGEAVEGLFSETANTIDEIEQP